MIIPDYIDVYHKGRKLKVGSECPKELESTVQAGIDAAMKRAKEQGQSLCQHKDPEKHVECCAQYADYRLAVGRVLADEKKKSREILTEEKKESKKK
jgi:hypothetical protein